MEVEGGAVDRDSSRLDQFDPLIHAVADEGLAQERGGDRMGLDGAHTAARKLHYQILPLMEANFIESSPAPCKFVMKEMGLLEENLRLPLVPVTAEAGTKLRAVLSELGEGVKRS